MCGICGGDGRIMNGEARCPSCHGSGRKSEDTGMRDVTKTKPSHHRQTNKAQVVEKQTWPSSIDGGILADEIKACGSISEDTRARLIREILDHESIHGSCTQTFIKKVRKQIRPAAR